MTKYSPKMAAEAQRGLGQLASVLDRLVETYPAKRAKDKAEGLPEFHTICDMASTVDCAFDSAPLMISILASLAAQRLAGGEL